MGGNFNTFYSNYLVETLKPTTLVHSLRRCIETCSHMKKSLQRHIIYEKSLKRGFACLNSMQTSNGTTLTILNHSPSSDLT